MCDILDGPLVSAMVAATAGVVAWVGANFFAEPLLHFYKLRRSVRASLLYAANVDASRKEAYDSTYEEIRRHAVDLDALNETAPKIVKLFLRRRGFDISSAVSGLFGFSNSLGSYEDTRDFSRNRIRKALRFVGEF